MDKTKKIINSDAVVIGKGPAGIQAALYIARAGLSVSAIGYDAGSLALAEKIENYYGLPNPATGAELQKTGEAQARVFGAGLYDCEVVGLNYTDDGGFRVIAAECEFTAIAVLISTGFKRAKAAVDGVERFEGKGVGYCAVCDGFLYRGKKVGVLGHAQYAFSEARELAEITGSAVIFTNGATPDFGVEPTDIDPAVFEIVCEPIDRLEGVELPGSENPGSENIGGERPKDERLKGVRFKNGGFRELDGLFIAGDSAGGSDLARKLGVLLTPKGDIITEGGQATNVPGVYAAGDCTGAFRQIAVAVGQGALAARQMIDFIREAKRKK
jgi:thioredoxin reductase (NADPH)